MNDTTSMLPKPLPERKICDAVQDCKNNADEKNCRSKYEILISHLSFMIAENFYLLLPITIKCH